MATTQTPYSEEFRLTDGVTVMYPLEREDLLWDIHVEEYVTYEINGQRHLQMQYFEQETRDGLRSPCQYFDLADYEISRDEDELETTYFTIPRNLTVRKRTYQEHGTWYYETATDEEGEMDVVDRTPMRLQAVALSTPEPPRERVLGGYDDE